MSLVLEPNAAVPVSAGWREKARRAIQQAHDAGDMSPEEWEGFVDGLLKFLAEEAQEPEHAGDAEFNEADHPRAPDGKFGKGGGGTSGGPHDIYKRLADADDRGGKSAVEAEAKKIVAEDPSLADSILKEAGNLGYSQIGIEKPSAAVSSRAEEVSHPEPDKSEAEGGEKKEVAGKKRKNKLSPPPLNASEAQNYYDNHEVPEGWFTHGRSDQGAGKEDPLATGNVIQMTRSLDTADVYAGKKGAVYFLAPGKDADVIDVTDRAGQLRLKKAFIEDFEKGTLPIDLEDRVYGIESPRKAWEAVKEGFDPPDIVSSAEWYDTDVVNWLADKFPGAFFNLTDGAVALDPAKLQRHQVKQGLLAEKAKDAAFDALADAIESCADAALALDRESVRTKDIDGRLHVVDVPLCRESVDPYKGSEVPGYRKLGLDAEKIYHLWRPADELEKALPTLSGIPVLRKHVATSAQDHRGRDTIGAVGTNARWEAPFIIGELVIWPAEDIEGIESKEKYNLSPGYRYVPVMEIGDFNGTAYDGKMTDIAFNHVAVVEHGRQAEVAIDSVEELRWTKIERALLAI